MIKAIIFDMDGLLVDTEPVWTQAEIAAFATVGLTLTEEMTCQTRGLRLDAVVAHWFERSPWANLNSEAVQQRLLHEVEQGVRQHVKVLPGVRRTVSFFADRGYPLAVASSSPLRLIHAVLDSIGLRSYFPVLCSAELEKQGKPAPDVYLTTARKLETPPKHCLAFEDSLNGILSATRAGMPCIGVNSMPGEGVIEASTIFLGSLEDFSENHLNQLSLT